MTILDIESNKGKVYVHYSKLLFSHYVTTKTTYYGKGYKHTHTYKQTHTHIYIPLSCLPCYNMYNLMNLNFDGPKFLLSLFPLKPHKTIEPLLL